MQNSPDFIGTWDRYLTLGAYAFAAVAVMILLYHELRIFMIKDYKRKYDYVSVNEVKYFWYAMIALIAAAALYLNTLAAQLRQAEPVTWFYVRIFITMGFAAVSYYVFYSLIRIYYPRYVENRLNKLRNKPRISPAGNVMRKLKEAEEAAHLEADQFLEQKEVHSVDYDVWIDEKTGYKKIEKYVAYQHVTECPECGYVTLKIVNEELAQPPGQTTTGVLIKHYRCTYCHHREANEVVVAALSANTMTSVAS